MRMRQSLAELEQAFVEEIHQDRHRRESLRHDAAQRARARRAQREHKRSSIRFLLLCLTLLATAVIVTIAMFRALFLLLS
jgi:hypothetical protein